MAVSVIVSNFNGARFLPRLLETLRDQRDVTLEIIVVDRHSRDDSLALLAREPDVRVLHEPPETGLASGYAIGAECARYEHLFFCNEDMWFDDHCLALLERQIDLSRRVAAADPWQWTYDGRTWIHGGVRFRRCRWNLLSPHPLRRNSFTEPLEAGALVPFACAGAFLIHRQAYAEAGGWDRHFFLDYEDIDLFIRLWQAGWRCVTAPEAKVYHAVNASNAHQLPGAGQAVSRRRYISGRSSVPVIGLKYFTGPALLLPLLVWASMVANNLVKLRLRRAWWDLLALREVVRRYRPAVCGRGARGTALRTRPGQAFFLDPAFNAP